MTDKLKKKIEELQTDFDGFIAPTDPMSIIQYVENHVFTPSDRAIAASEESGNSLFNACCDVLNIAFKFDAIEVASRIALTSSNIKPNDVLEYKRTLDVQRLLKIRKSVQCVTSLMTGVVKALEEDRLNSYAEMIIKSRLMEHRTFAFFADFCVLENEDSIQIVLPTHESSSVDDRSIIDCEARMLANEVAFIQSTFEKRIDILLVNVKEPMIDSIVSTMSMPNDMRVAECLITGRLLAESFNPKLHYQQVMQLPLSTVSAVEEARAKFISGNFIPTPSSEILEIYKDVGVKHLALLEQYRNGVTPLLNVISDNFPYGYGEVCQLIQLTHDTLLSEVFDRQKIIDFLAGYFEEDLNEIKDFQISRLLVRLERNSADVGSNISLRRFRKDSPSMIMEIN